MTRDAHRLALERERAEHVAAIARINAVLGPEPADDDGRLTLVQAMVEFGRSEDTVRRWARDLGLGEKSTGRWLLDRAAVIEFLGRRA